MKTIFLFTLAILVTPAHAASVTSPLTITVFAPMTIAFNPPAPSIGCGAPAGTVVTGITSAGGDNAAIGVTMTGDTTDFALSAATLPANVIVGTNGIAAANCGKTNNVTITATQN